jgi:serine O-acetyltransferase
MFEVVRADIRRVTSQEHSTIQRLGMILMSPGLHAVLLYRLANWCYYHGMRPVAVLISYVNSVVTGSQISPAARIGRGLMVYHPHGMVVGATSIIGAHCTLAHVNMIGQKLGGGDRPIIGDYFHAGTGAKVLGAIKIGNNVTVGANAVVLDPLPDDVIVAGIPARIIKVKAPSVAAADTATLVGSDVRR